MAKKGDMLYAWTNDADLAEEGGMRRCSHRPAGSMRSSARRLMPCLPSTAGVDLYDAVPVIVTDPKDLDKTRRFAPLRNAPPPQTGQ